MTDPILPGAHSQLTDKDGRTTGWFYNWFRRLQTALDASTLAVASLTAQVAAITPVVNAPTDVYNGVFPIRVEGADNLFNVSIDASALPSANRAQLFMLMGA